MGLLGLGTIAKRLLRVGPASGPRDEALRPIYGIEQLLRQDQGPPDVPAIAGAMVSSLARSTGAQRASLLLPTPKGLLEVIASAGMGGTDLPDARSDSPFMARQTGPVPGEEVWPLPQWQGLPDQERAALSA